MSSLGEINFFHSLQLQSKEKIMLSFLATAAIVSAIVGSIFCAEASTLFIENLNAMIAFNTTIVFSVMFVSTLVYLYKRARHINKNPLLREKTVNEKTISKKCDLISTHWNNLYSENHYECQVDNTSVTIFHRFDHRPYNVSRFFPESLKLSLGVSPDVSPSNYSFELAAKRGVKMITLQESNHPLEITETDQEGHMTRSYIHYSAHLGIYQGFQFPQSSVTLDAERVLENYSNLNPNANFNWVAYAPKTGKLVAYDENCVAKWFVADANDLIFRPAEKSDSHHPMAQKSLPPFSTIEHFTDPVHDFLSFKAFDYNTRTPSVRINDYPAEIINYQNIKINMPLRRAIATQTLIGNHWPAVLPPIVLSYL